MRFAGQMVDQVGAHLIEHRHLEQQLAPIVRLGLQHLFTEVVGDEPIGAAELGDEVVRSSWSRSVMPANCRPAAQPSVRLTRAVTLSALKVAR